MVSFRTFTLKKNSEAVVRRCSVKRCSQKFLKIHRKTPVPQTCNFIKKETLVQGVSCEFCEISKNTFFYRIPLLAAFNYKRFKRIIKFRVFKIGALRNFAIFTEKHLCWPLQAFFYGTPIVTASTFSRQQTLFFR